MKVLHLLNTSSFSGAENMVCQIIKMFDGSEIDMAYCSRDGSIRDVLDELNIKFFSIEKMTNAEINRVIDEFNPDVLHAHDMKAAFIASQNLRRIPIVCHIHNNDFDSRRISPKSIAFLIASIKIKHIFWVSEEAMDQYMFAKFVKRKSTVLYNILDIELLYKKMNTDKSEYSYDTVFVGRLSEEKNPLRLIQIIDMIRERKPDISMAIVGEGEFRTELEELIEEKNLCQNVSLKGFQNNPLKIVKDSSVMVMTSIREGLPMCALEAQIVGTPIVSTPVGAMDKIIDNGVNGFLCESDDEFVDKITNIVIDKEMRNRLSEQSISFANRFNNKEAFMLKLEKYYLDAMQ